MVEENLIPCACGCNQLVTTEVRSHRRFYSAACRAKFSYYKNKLLDKLFANLKNSDQLKIVEELNYEL